MNAQLKPIAPAITRPEYDNSMLGFEEDWIRDNYSALSDWYSLLSVEVGAAITSDEFKPFAQSQHDIQLEIRRAYRETHSKWRDS